MRSSNAVEPTRSANTTVTTLRPAAGDETAGALSAGAPHSSQKRKPGESSTPQAAHRAARGLPQNPQNLALARFGCRHAAQSTEPPPVITAKGYRVALVAV